MAKRKSGLGNRGVEVLLSTSRNTKPSSEQSSLDIDVSLINVSPYQPRSTFNDDSLKSLISSIKEQGVIQPILIRKTNKNSYELIAGERRLRAVKVLGYEKIPAIIKSISDESAAIYALLENIQREDLNPIEEAMGLEKLIKKFKFTQEKLAQKTGKSRSHIANLIRLLSLDKYVIGLLSDRKIDMGHARALLSLGPASQKLFADRIVSQKLSVREIEKLVTDKGDITKHKPSKSKKDKQISEIENQLREKLGIVVEISHSQGKKNGKIILKYSNLDVLDGLLKKLGYKK
ncbi:MAG: ParB/RepB/Spo0J family partition protein [Gammaproteobacteria bacterium]|jgi:ParB family transcriptional regulator, chromosome partitioning protein|nr:ParB/RepB/Spo0J family partition protein [Gammaproteobacteria bacterium]MBT7603704.1 ParB/RepB/Spo0J family partition protein [Gammaproteobacteria bacterium]